MRRMSFSLTERPLLDGTKSVTRRLGWANLRPGERLLAVRKAMGLKKGERQVVLCEIEIVAVRRVWLRDPKWITPDDCAREGFPELTPAGFVLMFCSANRCHDDCTVTRIEFRKVN